MGNYSSRTMVERPLLDDVQAREVEEQLFATLRQQTGRHVPIVLPRRDFWEKVGQLLDTIEMQIHEIYRTRGPDLRLQNLQKRQANIRRTSSELARKRLVSFQQHASSVSLRSEGGIQNHKQDLPALDWGRHDPAEREFYSSVVQNIDRFKLSVNWNGMQHGLASEGTAAQSPLAAGTMQLDTFIEQPGGLTGQGPPTIALEDDSSPLQEIETDEEDILAMQDAYPELEGMEPTLVKIAEPSVIGQTHAAATELAPAKKKESIDFNAWAAAEAGSPTQGEIEKEPQFEEDSMIRIRVLQSMDEPIMTIDGEISLEAGDIHFLDQGTADWLVDAGVAEKATL
ncbi:MAG: hypothetical protein CXT71_01160 [Methanobacteriota archaeon]|jgi:hypothetical protein|nr:MAG: hypothetical protein CXT71_01160 [Euryarchaeota archaeon]